MGQATTGQMVFNADNWTGKNLDLMVAGIDGDPMKAGTEFFFTLYGYNFTVKVLNADNAGGAEGDLYAQLFSDQHGDSPVATAYCLKPGDWEASDDWGGGGITRMGDHPVKALARVVAMTF